MKIRPIKKEDKEELLRLLNQLTGEETDFDIDAVINDAGCSCVVLEEGGSLIGSATLSVYVSPVKGMTGVIEDVIVDEKYRGQGLGRKLMEELIKIGKEKDLSLITLTSNPKREAARNLYQSLGFKLKDTGFFFRELKK